MAEDKRINPEEFFTRSVLVLMVLSLLLACSATTHYYQSRAVPSPSHDGTEWHSCQGGGVCAEGWACVKDGCEWCGGGDGTPTRCTNGNDGANNGM